MKLLGVSGSLRAASFNTALLHAAQAAAPEGVTIEIFGLHDLPLFNQDVEDQGDPEPVKAWKEAVRSADALLLACPEYNGGITGVLKNAIDWASRMLADSPLRGKLAAVMGASPSRGGTERAQAHLREILERAGAHVVDEPSLYLARAFENVTDGRLTSEDYREAVGEIVTSLDEAVTLNATEPAEAAR